MQKLTHNQEEQLEFEQHNTTQHTHKGSLQKLLSSQIISICNVPSGNGTSSGIATDTRSSVINIFSSTAALLGTSGTLKDVNIKFVNF